MIQLTIVDDKLDDNECQLLQQELTSFFKGIATIKASKSWLTEVCDMLIVHINNYEWRRSREKLTSKLVQNMPSVVLLTTGASGGTNAEHVKAMNLPENIPCQICPLPFEISGKGDYLRLCKKLRQCLVEWKIGEKFPIECLLPNLLEPFIALKILLHNYLHIYYPQLLATINGEADFDLNKGITTNALEFNNEGFLDSPCEWFKDSYDGFESQIQEGIDYFLSKDGSLWCFSGFPESCSNKKMLSDNIGKHDRNLLIFKENDRSGIASELIELLGSDGLIKAHLSPVKKRKEEGDALKRLCEALAKCARGETKTAFDEKILTEFPRVVTNAYKAILRAQSIILGQGNNVALMSDARMRLNHDDIKNLRHCIEHWGGDESKFTILLNIVWPKLGKKLRCFLRAVKNVWCLQDTKFETDSNAVLKVITDIDDLSQQPFTPNVVSLVLSHLDDLWWFRDEKARGLLSGERFHMYNFTLTQNSKNIDIKGDIARAIEIGVSFQEMMESLINSPQESHTVMDVLRNNALWETRYSIDKYLWTLTTKINERGGDALNKCYAFVYDSLRVFIDVLFQLPSDASIKNIINASKKRTELGGKGVHTVMEQTDDIIARLGSIKE